MNTRPVFSSTYTVRAYRTAAGFLCLLALACEPSRAFADGGPPTRIGNTYEGFDHQPTQSDETRREQADRINLSSSQQKRIMAILDHLYLKLEGELPAGAMRNSTALN